MRMHRMAWLAAFTTLCGCNLAPNYQPPHFILPADYQGSAAFSVATPQDALARGPWWLMFGDPELDRLEQQAVTGNPDLAAAAEAYTQSRDLAAEAEAGMFPRLGAQASVSENKQSFNRLFRNNPYSRNIESSNELEGSVSWEPDLWGEIRNRARAQRQLAQASAAEFAAAQLSLQSQLANEYFALRGLDAELVVYRQAANLYTTAVEITRLRLAGSISSGLDVARAENQLAATEALATDVAANRAVLQHAIADLVGVSASSFVLPPQSQSPLVLPEVPVSVPAALLQRRPDIAEAERRMAAANTSIGVARAAFYPNGVISAFTGFQDNGFALASLPNSLWSVGGALMLPLIEGGLRRAELQRSWSIYAQTRDGYRSTVLSAFQEVEDALTLTQQLKLESAQETQAVNAATTAQALSMRLYTDGLSDYLDVVVAQETALTAEIAETGVRTRQMQAAVQLILALGGGWNTAQLPSAGEVMPFSPYDKSALPGGKVGRSQD